MSDAWALTLVIATIALAVAVFVGGIAGIGMTVTYFTSRSDCRAFARESGYETKFEHMVEPLGVPISWECFARQDDGRWIPKSRLREVE